MNSWRLPGKLAALAPADSMGAHIRLIASNPILLWHRREPNYRFNTCSQHAGLCQELILRGCIPATMVLRVLLTFDAKGNSWCCPSNASNSDNDPEGNSWKAKYDVFMFNLFNGPLMLHIYEGSKITGTMANNKWKWTTVLAYSNNIVFHWPGTYKK